MDKKILTEAFEKFLGEDVSEKTIQRFIEIVAKKYMDAIGKEFGGLCSYGNEKPIITKEKSGGKTTQVFLKLKLNNRFRGRIGEYHKEQNATAVFNTMEHTARELENNVMIKNDIVAKINFPVNKYKLSDMGGYLTVLIMEYSRVQKDENTADKKEKNKKDLIKNALGWIKKDYFDLWFIIDHIGKDGEFSNVIGHKDTNLGVIDPELKKEAIKLKQEIDAFRTAHQCNLISEYIYKMLLDGEKLLKSIETLKNKFNKGELLKKAKKLAAE